MDNSSDKTKTTEGSRGDVQSDCQADSRGLDEWFDLNHVFENIGYFGRFHWYQLTVLFIIGLRYGH